MMAFDRLGEINHDQNIVIQGDGPLGLFAAAVSVTRGPKRIILIGGSSRRLALVRQWGVTDTISIADIKDPEERKKIVLDLTEGRGGEIVLNFPVHPTPSMKDLNFKSHREGDISIVGQFGEIMKRRLCLPS